MDYKNEGNVIDFKIDYTDIINDEIEETVLKTVNEIGYEKLKPIKDALPNEITYDQIRAVLIKNFK